MVQSASMVGIGIYLNGMAKKSYTESMLEEMEAIPISEINEGREGHSLAAGFSLGLINLGKGSKIPSIRDINIDERLFRFLDGGEKIEDRQKDNNISEYQSCNVKGI